MSSERNGSGNSMRPKPKDERARGAGLRPRTGRAPSLRQIRLVAGLVVFTYVTLHFANHALGNISVEAMENGLAIQKWLWQSPTGAIILYSALLTHMGLGFWALYTRRDFRWTRMEATQLILGLSIPFLLADHVIGTRVSLSLFGTEKGYAEVLLKFWVRSPISGALQAALLLIVWIHGCIGVLSWLRLIPTVTDGDSRGGSRISETVIRRGGQKEIRDDGGSWTSR